MPTRTACFNYQGRSAESKLNLPQITFNNNQAFTHIGLRSFNKLHVRTARATSGSSDTSEKSLGKIVCGMSLVFVGAEVGPWSKTGGLGDVLGGLPPVLAVSYFCITLIILVDTISTLTC